MELENGLTNATNVTIEVLERHETMQERAEQIFREPANVVIVVLALIGLMANILTAMATAYIPGRQTTHSKLIISLSLADICITISIFLHVWVTITSRPHLREYCLEVANRGFLTFALLASLINLLVMGIDHYVAVIRPLHYHLIMSPTRANIILVAIWIISALGGFLEIIVGGFLHGKESGNFCFNVLYNNNSFDAQLLVLCFVVLEMLTLIYLYCHIFQKIKSSTYIAQLNAQSLLQRQSANSSLHSKKAIITTILIVGTFMVTWIPYSVYNISGVIVYKTCDNLEYLNKFVDIFIKIHNILWILVQCNCIFDPLIYAVRTPVVQQGYKRMMNKLNLCHSMNNKTPVTRRYSYRASARTYSSELDIQLAQEPQHEQ